MIPAVAERGLAVFADVFCEQGVFSVEESRRILLAARERGMKLRVHADELAATGGAELAAELGARSADHLVHVSPAGMRALAASGCVATLLPSAAFYLRLGRFAPARALIEAGAPVALASDVNPGGGLSPSLPFAMALALLRDGPLARGGARRGDRQRGLLAGPPAEVGSIETGKRADLVLLRSARLLDLVRVGVPAIRSRGEGRPRGRARRPPRRAGRGARVSVPVRALSIHADYRCRSSGACCRSGWEIPVEPEAEERIHAGIARGPAASPARLVAAGARACRTARAWCCGCCPSGDCVFLEHGEPRLCAVAAAARRGRAAAGVPAVPAGRDAHAARASR